MPLVAQGYLAVLAGLLAGLGLAWPVAAMLGAGASALCVAARRGRVGAAAAMLVGSGTALGALTRAHDGACLAELGRRRTLVVTLTARAVRGHLVRAGIDGPCPATAAFVVDSGGAPAAWHARVTGRVARTGRGRFVVRAARVEPVAPAGALLRVRARVARDVDRLFGSDAPVVHALLLADEHALDPAQRARFADAGIVHLLSVSGLHVAVIAAATALLLRVARLGARAATVASIGTAAAYVLVIGAPAPAVRSVVMLGTAAASRMLQRPTSRWAALALGALVPLARPRSAADLGYQLSVLGMTSLVAGGVALARVRRWRARRAPVRQRRGWRREVGRRSARLAEELAISGLVAAVTAPLLGWTFGKISLVSPLSNVVAAPIFALLQPTLFLAVAAAWCPPLQPLAATAAAAAHPLIAAIDVVARVAAAAPLAAVPFAPSVRPAVAFGVASAALVVACASRSATRALLVAACALAAAVWLSLAPYRSAWTELHVLDVGQGDALALRTPRGRWLLFDAGRDWSGGDAGASVVVPYLRRLGGDVAVLVISHPHSDHVGGAASVVEALRPQMLMDAGYVAGSDSYRRTLAAAGAARVPWRRPRPGDSLVVDGVVVTVLAPDSAWLAGLRDPNEGSVVAAVRYGAVRMLLAGDAERAEEDWLVRNAGMLRADVLKVAHHGSATSSTPAFLDAVRPRLALVSVGAGNRYGHPSAAVVRALRERQTEVLRTDLLGTMIIRTDGRHIEGLIAGDRWRFSPDSALP